MTMIAQPRRGGLTLLLALALLIQPGALAATAVPEPQQTARRQVFLPVINTPIGPPAFVIASPGAGWSLAGTSLFAVQPTTTDPISSVSFSAGTASLGTDSTPADGFRVFLDARRLPAGPLTLRAAASGPGGRTTQTVQVTVVQNPPRSGALGPAGGVLASQIGSVITIPPGALPNGTQVSVAERSLQEITARTGIDWESLGVTFLGAQDVAASAPFALPPRVASAGFGQRVQPGQAVVNYQIMPDVNGDGVDEIIVVNTASVAPSRDVVSDPVAPATLIAAATPTRGLGPAQANPVSGPPGTPISFAVAGFNPLSAAGNIAEWTCADGRQLSIPGSVTVQQGRQTFSTMIPNCRPGPALVRLLNSSTGSRAGPFTVTVTAPPPLGGPPGDGSLDFLGETEKVIDALPPALDPPTLPPDWRDHIQEDLDNAREAIDEKQSSPDPNDQQDLADADNLAPEPDESEFPPPGGDDCLTQESKEAIDRQINSYQSLGSNWYHRGEQELANYYWNIARDLFELSKLPTCDEDDEPPDQPPDDGDGNDAAACRPNPGGGGGGTTGMGAAAPPGGNGCGNIHGGSGPRATAP